MGMGVVLRFYDFKSDSVSAVDSINNPELFEVVDASVGEDDEVVKRMIEMAEMPSPGCKRG